ncbi:T9SS sorting signal type C domain-containing protein [Flavobacterium mekongense]|uniref:T9SS sorting signal type C domain-containing protein n=1 Tax=Flavobacterium mekongense TaxID=3379707 RepID=UPI00399AC5F5
MKRTLLSASSNGLLSKNLTTLLVIAIWFLGTAQAVFGQTCVGPYKGFNSSASSLANLPNASLDPDANWNVTGFIIGTVNARSGRYTLQQASAAITNGSVVTPMIDNFNDFSCYIRKAGNTTAYSVQLSDDNGTTWTTLTNGSNTITGVYNTFTVTATIPTLPAPTTLSNYLLINISGAVPASPVGYRVRINDTRAASVTGALYLDDFSWTSANAAENTIVIPKLAETNPCTITVPTNQVYYFHDVAGNTDLYSLGQDNKVIFTPADNTYKIRATVEAFNLKTTVNVFADYLQLYNDDSLTPANQVGGNYGGTTSFGTYTSSFSNGSLGFRFVTNATAPTTVSNVGYRIKIECIRCTVPTAFTGNGSFDSASLSWSGTASGYDVYYSSTNTAPNGATVPQIVNNAGTTATVTGLANSSTYYMWVRSNCGGGDYSGWAGPVTITTICPPTTVTYFENFNGLNLVLPTCTSATSTAWQTNITNGNLFTNAEGTTFFTRGVTLTAGQPYRLSYDYSSNGNGTADMAVAYGMTNFAPTPSNITTGIAYHTEFSNIQLNIVNFTPLVTGTYYIGFTLDYLSDPSGGAMNLDNVRLELESCLQPTGLAVTGGSITTSGATLTWNVPATGAPSNGYEYFVSTTNIAPGFNDVASGTSPTNSVVLNTLSPGTLYYVWVRGNCGGQKSVWINIPVSFTTTASVNVVVEIDATTSPSTGCNFTFLDSGGASAAYQNNETYTYTFIPGTAGSKLKAVFGTFNTENNYDGLMIYSGTTANPANLISSGRAAGNNATTCPAGAFSGTTSPGTVISTSADGALTFVFRSDISITPAGWSATISCVTPPVITDFNPKNNSCGSNPTPTVIITGTNLSGVTSVTFNGVPATSFAVNSATQITAVFPIAATTGKIVLTNATASSTSTVDFEVQSPGPATTGGEVCAGGTGGTIMTNVSCSGFGAATTSIAGTLNAATDPTAPRLEGMTISPTCSFVAGSIRNYVAYDFQVSVSGSYTFTMNTGGFDGMGYITQLGFTAGDCGSGTFVVGDDDSGPGLLPMLTANLVTGVTYTLFTTTFGTTGTSSGAYTWGVTPPVGGGVMPFTNSVTQWYTAASGGTPIGTGSPFNPVGVAGSGIPNNLAVGVYTFYAACSTNPNCRTATTFEIKPGPTPTLPANFATCANEVTPLTVTGAGNTFTWTSTVANTLFSDAAGTVPYVPMTNATTVYVKTPSTVTVTVLATLSVNGCQRSASVIISTPSTTWNGTAWSAGAPNANTAAIFNGNYVAAGNLSACSVTINSGAVSFGVGQTLTVTNDVKVLGGSLTMGNESSLLQINNTTNTGNITYVRASAPVVRYDYSYWSTPVSPQTLGAASPSTSWDGFYSYSGTAWQWAPSSTVMGVGRGYIIRVPLSYSTTIPSSQIVNFVGVPNNGTYTVPIVGGSNQLNLLGNPYPSALNADLFMSANSTVLDGTIYLWTHNTPITAGQYDQDDYAVYNYLGGTGTSASPNPGLNTEVPTGKIASGQGFFIKGLANGNATFTNAMRVAGNNDQFFRMSQPTAQTTNTTFEKHRYWIDVFNATGVFKQNLFGYVTGGTMGIDRGMDSEVVNLTSPIVLYSKVGDTKLAIQGRGLPFDVNDQIPLAYKSTVATSYTIRLSIFDGLFENQDIFLEDKVLNVIHNLKGSDYTFTTAVGTFEDRFVLRYTDATLGVGNPVFDDNTVVVYRNGQGLIVNSGAVNMTQVTVFDIRGRMLAEQKQVNDTETVFTTLPETQQVLLVKIKAENGAEITKKVVY